MKKAIKIISILLLGVMIALLIIPFIFKDQIVEKIREGINDQIRGDVQFEDVNVSMLKNFPKLTITIKNLNIIGQAPFEGKELFRCEKNIFTLNLISVFKLDAAPLEINNIHFKNGKVAVVITEEGRANYDILIDDSAETQEQSDIAFDINHYQIENFNIAYLDKSGGIKLDMQAFNFEGSGNFKKTQFDLRTSTSAKSLSLSTAGISYLNKVKLNSNAIIGVNLDNNSYTFRKADLTINSLTLLFDGVVRQLSEGMNIDLTFESKNTDIRNLISLIPGLYKNGIENAKVKGSMAVKGVIKGQFNSQKEQYPKFDIRLVTKNGYISYPDLPMPIENINLDAKILNNSSNLDATLIEIKDFVFNIGEGRTQLRLALRNMISNPKFDFTANGKLNFDDLSKAIPMDGVNKLEGNSEFDITAKGAKNDIDNNNYKNIEFNGDASFKDIVISLQDQVSTNIDNLNLHFSPQFVKAHDVRMLIGNTDLAGEVVVLDPLMYFVENSKMKLDIDLSSQQLDLTEWITDNMASDSVVDNSELIDALTRVEIQGRYKVDKVTYPEYKIQNVDITVNQKGEKLYVEQFYSDINGNMINIDGKLDNVLQYGLADKELRGTLNLSSKQINLDNFQDEEENMANEGIVLPDNVNLDMHFQVENLQYDKIEMTQVKGNVNLVPNEILISDFVAKGLGGEIKLNGALNTSDSDNPLFKINYALSKLGISETYNSVSSFKYLAPISKYVQGVLNSTLELGGSIDPKSLMPDLNTLNLEGILETLDGNISGYGPIEKVKKLFIDSDKAKMVFKNTKHHVRIQDGQVVFKPFPVHWDGIDFIINASHGFDQNINYVIQAEVPRDKLNTNALGKLMDSGAKKIVETLSKTGIKVNVTEIIKMEIILTGNIANPKMKINPISFNTKNISDQITDQIEDQIDQVSDSIETVANETMDTVTAIAIEAKDSIVANIEKEKDALLSDVKDKAVDVLTGNVDSLDQVMNADSILNNIKESVDRVIPNSSIDKVDSLAEKIKGWNPFKKKNN